MKPEKFDKIMEIGLKITCLLLVACIAGGLVVSCVRPVSAKAFDDPVFPNWYWDYLGYSTQYFWDSTKDKHDLLEGSISEDDSSSPDYGLNLQAWALQDAFIHFFQLLYKDNESDYFATMPDSVAVSGSSAVGVYKIAGDSDHLYPVTLLQGTKAGDILVSSQHFDLAFGFGQYVYTFTPVFTATDDGGFKTGYDNFNPNSGYWEYQQPKRFFAISQTISDLEWANRFYYLVGSDGYIPTFNGSGSVPNAVGKYVSSISLPSGDANPYEPWTYYNTVILPYLKNTLNVSDNYIYFPNGYYPPVEPTEPPTQLPVIPGGGTTINAPIIVGAGAIVVAGNASFNVFAPVNGYLNVDGIDIQFTPDGKVTVKGDPFDIPMPEMDFGGKGISVPVRGKVVIDGVEFNFNPDGTITIGDINYNLPVGEPETLASDADTLVYKYEIPTVEDINVIDAHLSSPDLSSFSDGVSWIFQAAQKVYTDSGLMPVVLVCLSLGFISYAVWRIGG